jgi:hypothetical protein
MVCAGVVWAALAGCQRGYVQDAQKLRAGKPANKESVELSDTAGDAKKAFAAGDWRWVHAGIVAGRPEVTEAESALFRGQKQLTVEGGGLRAESQAGDAYAKAYNRALADLIKGAGGRR